MNGPDGVGRRGETAGARASVAGCSPADLGTDLRTALRAATSALAAAGVPSPEQDAVALAAHLLATTYGEVRRRTILGEPTPHGYAALVARRARRVPLQHLTGAASFRKLELAVGPGVFVPRPETEVLVDHVLAELASAAALGDTGCAGGAGEQIVVDLCTGSGAIALAVADEADGVAVWAVELSPEAIGYARRNIAGTGLPVSLVAGDASAGLPELVSLTGRVDVVTCNPPYIPDGMVPRDAEVRDHDPGVALYGRSADGLAVPLLMARRAAELLRPGGLLAMEHADAQGETLPAALRAQGCWVDVLDVPDLTGRPRVTLARRA